MTATTGSASSCLLVAVAFTLLFPALAAADESDATGRASANEGVAEIGINPRHEGYGLYQSLCSDCHGVRADGNGPRADKLAPPPVDLTQLRGPDGGPPRLDTITRLIDGRRTLRAHEANGMPIWGEQLVANEPDIRAREPARIQLVQALASYVLSLQTTK